MLATIRLGSDLLFSSTRLKGARVGVVCNHASVDRGFRHVIDRLAAAAGVSLAALFRPRRVPISSLYSETREPTPEMLRGIDVLLVDLQDIGARIYTYIYTMANCLRAAGRHGVPAIVCGRPNPIGGTAVEGARLRHEWESFVGLFPIPMRHGMTIGELAQLFNKEFGIGASLEVIPMEGWTRAAYADSTGLPWVMPSPNMPTLDTAIVYPGTVLFEGTMLSEGRGTTRPFELVGVPWIEAESFARQMNGLALPGAYFRPAVFEPTFQKHAKTTCGGCQIHVTDRASFRPVLTGAALLHQFRRVDPENFAWRQPPYEYEHDKLPIDIHAGSSTLREQIEGGVAPKDIAASWRDNEAAFRKARQPFLL